MTQTRWLEALAGNQVYLYGLENLLKESLETEGNYSIAQLSKELKVNPRNLYYWLEGKKPVPLDSLLVLMGRFESLNSDNIEASLRFVSFGSGPRKRECYLPFKLTPELAYLVGYAFGDGYLNSKDWTIGFCDEYDSQISLIKEILESQFKVKTVKKRFQNKTELHAYSKGLWLYLNKVFDFPAGEKKGRLKVPNLINNSNAAIQKEFVKGFFDADGGVPRIEEYDKIPTWMEKKPQISLSQASEGILLDLKDLMYNFKLNTEGPFHNRANKGYSITLTGVNKIRQCHDFQLFRHPVKRERLGKLASIAQRQCAALVT